VDQGGDDAVRRPGHLAEVCGAPEDVARMEVQHIFPRHVVRQHDGVHMDGPFGMPVAPLVKCRMALSSGSVTGMVKSPDLMKWTRLFPVRLR
jgi:hypothetical protein